MKKRYKLFGLVLSCMLIFQMTTIPVYALNWLSSPSHPPIDLDEVSMDEWKAQHGGENSDWVGVYYAEGMGLELTIFSNVYVKERGDIAVDENGNPAVYMSVHDYNYDKEIFCSEMICENGENQLVNTITGSILTRTADDTIQVDFSEEAMQRLEKDCIQLYMNQTSVEFTAVEKLNAEPAEDHWSGTYIDDSQDTSQTILIFYSLKQLYGTSDYLHYMNWTQNRKEEGTRANFYTAKGNLLVHAYPPGPIQNEVTFHCLGQNESGDLCTWDYVMKENNLENLPEASFVYQRVADIPTWESDADGYVG